MLDLWQNDTAMAQQPGAQEGRDLPATFGETFQDAWSNGQLATSGIRQQNARNQAVSEYIDQIKKAGGDFDSAYAKQVTPNYEPDALSVANDVVAGMKAKGGYAPMLPKSEDDINRRAVEISQGAIAAHAQMGRREQTWGSWFGNIAGSTAAALNDPYNIPMMAIPLEGLGVIGTAAAVGAGMAGTQVANEAANAGFNEKVQPGYTASGQAVKNVAEAGLGGLALGAGGAVLGKVGEAIAGRFMGTAERDLDNLRQSEANIAETNVLPGVQGEAAHPAALGKAIDDVLKENPVDVSQQVGALEPRPDITPPQPAAAEKPAIPELPAEPAVHRPAEIAESLAQPEVHDAIRADIERAIDESAKAGKALQIPMGVDENGEAVFGSATRALTEVDHYKALADAMGQCALPMAQQAAE